MTEKKYIIKKISAAETRNLRQLILRPHQKAEELNYPGDEDLETVHFGLYYNNKLSGIASVYRDPLPGSSDMDSWRLRGMATAEETRGFGFGKALMYESLNYAKSKTGKLFWCNARTTAEKFYEKFLMKRMGDIFYPEGLGAHVVMVLELNEINL